MQKAYQKQVRRVAIFRTLNRFRQRGENPFIRALNDARILLIYSMTFKKTSYKKKSQLILVNVVKQASVLILLEKRLEIYTLNGKLFMICVY